MYLFRTVQADMEFLLKICWSIEFKQKAEIADSLSLLISCSAIFDFYLGKAKHQGKEKLFRGGLDGNSVIIKNKQYNIVVLPAFFVI